VSAERTYIIRVLPGQRYDVVYENGHQRAAGELSHLSLFLQQSAIATGETLERVEREEVRP
jgi:hypothetical protein